MSLANNPLDKRHYHGVFTKHSPFRIAPVKCQGPCGQIIESTCLLWPPGSTICHLCFLQGAREKVRPIRAD